MAISEIDKGIRDFHRRDVGRNRVDQARRAIDNTNMPLSIREIHDIGESPERIVNARTWRGLTARQLSVVGLTDGGPGYDMQRPRPTTGHILISYGGAGEVWMDEQWQACSGGQAYIAPANVPMGFRTVGRRRWQFAWVFLPTAQDGSSPIGGLQPRVEAVDPRPIVNAIEGLYLESTGRARTERLDLWGDLVRHYAIEIATGGEEVDPLWRLWAEVDARLAEDWSLDRLAEQAGMQPEALRRLSLRTTGRSPMRQVTHLRMRRAEILLRSTGQKMFNISRQVGYENAFAFSTAFHRWKGKAPRACRSA